MKSIKKLLCVVLSCAMLLSLAIAAPASVSAKAKPKLNKKKITLTKGKTFKLKLKHAKASKVKWSSSKKSVATVKKGKITAKKKGKATITAKYKGKKYKCKVTVKPKVRTFGKTFKVYKDDTLQLVLKNSWGLSYNAKSWKSSKKSVATINKDGLVKGKKTGTTTITAYDTNGDEIKGTVKVIDPFKALKDYINKNGTKDYNGNKCISYSDSYYNCYITYISSDKKLEFRGDYRDRDLSVYMTLGTKKSSSAPVTVKYFEDNEEDSLYFTTSADIYPKTFTSSTNLDFVLDEGNTDATKSANLSNDILKDSFRRWKNMLSDKLNMNVCALGFSNY